tara:strand:+ start:913 stop:1401 length:489 start_codon:yes stop_codon:yes gene_type:complete
MVAPIDTTTKVAKHKKAHELALQTPLVNYRDGFGCVGRSGKHVDKDSYLKYNSLLTHHGNKITLPTVGFLTVPFMGSGCGKVESEARLDFEQTYAPKSSLNNGVRNRFTPLVGCLANNIQNPKHIIPEDSKKDWTRGGFPTRRCKTFNGPFPKPLPVDSFSS